MKTLKFQETNDNSREKTIGFDSFVTLKDEEADFILRLEEETGRPVTEHEIRAQKEFPNLADTIEEQIYGSAAKHEEAEIALGYSISYMFYSNNFRLGETIYVDYTGIDRSCTDKGEIIYLDDKHAIAQFCYYGYMASIEFNREGISYDRVRKIIGKDIDHNEFDRFIDLKDDITISFKSCC